ncbi:MAG: ribonuclease Z [Candidatus Methanomethylophilaceae archaeon]|nr:ribonuclease Z [Candidatus Methanomethylophilaceae archaeon]
MEILFLGTGASLPSRNRSTSCIALRSGSDIILMDCGEGSQRQLMISPFSFMKIRAVLITHVHGDHILGLPGLLQTMGLLGRKDPLMICGPKGFAAPLKAIMDATEGETEYPVEVVEADHGNEFSVCKMKVSVFGTDHGLPSVGFIVSEPDSPGKLDRGKALSLGIKDGPDMARLKRGETVKGILPEQVVGPIRRGIRVAYTGDTRSTSAIADAIGDVDALIHESTYMSSETSLADSHFHSTALQAAATAKEAGVRYLFLTHISNRYDDCRDSLLEEAKAVFSETILADDFDRYEITNRAARKMD